MSDDGFSLRMAQMVGAALRRSSEVTEEAKELKVAKAQKKERSEGET